MGIFPSNMNQTPFEYVVSLPIKDIEVMTTEGPLTLPCFSGKRFGIHRCVEDSVSLIEERRSLTFRDTYAVSHISVGSCLVAQLRSVPLWKAALIHQKLDALELFKIKDMEALVSMSRSKKVTISHKIMEILSQCQEVPNLNVNKSLVLTTSTS